MDQVTEASVLIVEDDFFLAMELSSVLEGQGLTVIGPARDCQMALELLSRALPRYAILDINLAGEMAYPVADALRTAEVPFLFATAFPAAHIPEQYNDVPVCEKPYRPEELLELLGQKRQPATPDTLRVVRPIENLLLQQLSEPDLFALTPHMQRMSLSGYQDSQRELVCFPEDGVCSLALKGVAVAMVGREGVIGAPQGPLTPTIPFDPIWHEDATVIAISAEPFRTMAARSVRMQSLLADYYRTLTVQIAWTAYATARLDLTRRLARWILMAADRLGSHFHITHVELSQMLGVRRAGVTTSLHILEGEQMIRSSRGLISIRNRTALESLVGVSYGSPEQDYARNIAQWPPPQE